MSQWKLVEAEPVNAGGERNNNFQQNKQFGNNMNRGGNKKFDNNRTGTNVNQPRRNNNMNGKDNRNKNPRVGGRRQQDIFIPDTPETRQQYAAMAVQLLEFYFSDDSLSCDTFVRSYFDTAGYIPIAFVCNFPDVVAIGAFYEDIVGQLSLSEKFEIDAENETMRVAGWEKWLMPNQEGGFGLPRYIKSPVDSEQQQEVSLMDSQRDRSGSKELSVTASEFVFNAPTTK